MQLPVFILMLPVENSLMPQLPCCVKMPCYQGPCNCQRGIELDNPLKYQFPDLNYDHHHPHLLKETLSCVYFKLKV